MISALGFKLVWCYRWTAWFIASNGTRFFGGNVFFQCLHFAAEDWCSKSILERERVTSKAWRDKKWFRSKTIFYREGVELGFRFGFGLRLRLMPISLKLNIKCSFFTWWRFMQICLLIYWFWLSLLKILDYDLNKRSNQPKGSFVKFCQNILLKISENR